MGDLRFDDRVVIVTGAGNGLGRAHALLFASRGAKVVVNDLGGDIRGGGGDAKAADLVVAEIQEAGGEAVASYDSVEDGDEIVQCALDTWGRVDVVVNNAGILRDVSFHKMTEDDWEKIYRVHVYGSFKVTHAAWPHMREQRYGRVVMTASAAGIYGNFGQANYAMAKLGLLGMSNTLAVEGRKRGIVVNTVAPIAGSRLTETVLPPNLIEALRPEYVSPLVAYLGHESCEDSGGLYEVGGGFFAKLRFERAKGQLLRLGREMRIEDIERSWPKITSFDESTAPADIASSMAPIMENIEAGPSKGGNEYIDVDRALGYEYPEQTSSYDERDLAMYALGVGAATDPLDEGELRYVYEMHGGGFRALPTYGVIPAINTILTMAKEGVVAPGLSYGLERLLHGEQKMTLHHPLPPKARLTHRSRITDIFDKGKGALIVTQTESFDETGEKIATNEFVAFIKGAGGWGGDPGPKGPRNEPPDRAPDAVEEQRIGDNQALLYRLSGDWNPLHADPSFAKAFGFERPILHGLCTMGYAARHVLKHFAPEGDPRLFESIDLRFSKSVFPGETLVTEMWKEPDGRVLFRTKVKERDEVVLQNGAITFYEELPKREPKAEPAAAEAAGTEPAEEQGSVSADVFLSIKAYLAEHPELVDATQKVFQFKLTDPDSVWTIDLANAPGSVGAGETAKPDCTLEISESDFADMSAGKADAQKLYFGGKLKISGDVMASQKLTFLSKIDPEWAKEKVAEMKAAGETMEVEASAGPSREPVAMKVAAALEKALTDNPTLKEEVNAVVELRVSDPDEVLTLDLVTGAVAEGAADQPAATLSITDEDLETLCTGGAGLERLFQQGKLRVDGDVAVARRMGFMTKLLG